MVLLFGPSPFFPSPLNSVARERRGLQRQYHSPAKCGAVGKQGLQANPVLRVHMSTAASPLCTSAPDAAF